MGKTFQVMVDGIRGNKMIVDLCNTEEQMRAMTVLQLKEKINERLPPMAGEVDMRLTFTEHQLEDDQMLSKYGIQHMSVIMVVLRVHGGAPGV